MVENTSERNIFFHGLHASSTAMVFAGISELTDTTILFILNDEEEAGYFYNDLSQLMGDNEVLFFPSAYRRAVKYGQKDTANEILRTSVLGNLIKDHGRLFIVTYPEALAQKVVAPKTLDENTMEIKRGEQYDLTELRQTLISMGFEQTDYVYEPGQFAIRGSILDIFSFSSENPFRLDFFGDDLDSIRTFDVTTQLSEEQTDRIVVVPEVSNEDGEHVSLMSFLPQNALVASKDIVFVAQIIDKTYDEGFSSQAIAEKLETATDEEKDAITRQMDKSVQLSDGDDFLYAVKNFRKIAFGGNTPDGDWTVVEFQTTPQPQMNKNFDLLAGSLMSYLENGYKLYILADNSKQHQRLKEIFDERREQSKGKENISFTPVDKTLHGGFSDADMKICVFTDHQIFGRYHKYNLKSDKARNGKVALSLKEIQELNINDYIVHVDHGIGRFGGLVRVPQGDGYQEMVRIVYQNNDTVYVSIHSLYKISKYRGRDSQPPTLSRLGTGQWERMKERTKKKLKDIARDLILLYSKRRQEKGFAFSDDNFMQHELEASFQYEDTPDQLKATNDVKADMEKARPMDRLVCGDVGFGKTEVAVRAAFKAACDNKQVAVMVPTTVLAFQHYQTFSERLKDFPVRVEYLSRARSAKDTKKILEDLASGAIDILIGTHKLVGKTVRFKDLGLLIIDEEQKFGVGVKEKLRQIKTNVDTLTMSATPIPRTLQFSLMGARDMSVIQTPPPNRYPIQTEVHTFSSDIIRDAINFEMSRNGQVFFVSNRIGSLTEIQNLIKELVPDARVVIGHGQMPPDELEKIVMGFINYDYDVLLSTTIVENGIDIPNANTIIINGAQHFGLSDLHQMRGRVGRSNKKAFCYLLCPPLSELNTEARRRMEAIENFSDLGSGINLAMQDLDIRGAGNLLGAEQSGFIADLGYETYQKILNQAVTELKNEEFSQLYKEDVKKNELSGDLFVDDCQLESDLEMYFPESYVPNSSERIILYRQLDGIDNDESLETYRKNLVDRFGEIPPVGEELLRVVKLRRLGKSLGVEKIVLKMGQMSLYFVSNENSAFYQSTTFDRILSFMAGNPLRCNLKEKGSKRWMTVKDVPSVGKAVDILLAISSFERNN